MKRIYLLMTLLVAFAANAFSKNVDLQVEHMILKDGAQQFTFIQNGDKIFSNNTAVGAKPKYQFRFLFIVPTTSQDTFTKNDKIMLAWSFNTTPTKLNLWGTNGIGKGDTVWYTTPSAGPGEVTSASTPSSKTNIQFCDTAWAVDSIGTGTVIPDPAINNNKRCNTVELTIWATYIQEALVEANTVFLFPNPATDKLNVKYAFNKPSNKAVITVYNMAGQVVYNKEHNGEFNGTKNFEMNLPQLNSGLYSVKITDNNGGFATEKFNIQ